MAVHRDVEIVCETGLWNSIDPDRNVLSTHLLTSFSLVPLTPVWDHRLPQGCYELISGPMNRHAWGVAWFGFAILCWTVSISLHMKRRELVSSPLVSPTTLDSLETKPQT